MTTKATAIAVSDDDESIALEAETLRAENAKIRRQLALATATPAIAAPPVAPITVAESNSLRLSLTSLGAGISILTLVGLIYGFVGAPIMGMRDDLKEIKASYARREDVVSKADYNTLKTQVDSQQQTLIRFDVIREQRNQEIKSITERDTTQDAALDALRQQGTRLEQKLDAALDIPRK